MYVYMRVYNQVQYFSFSGVNRVNTCEQFWGKRVGQYPTLWLKVAILDNPVEMRLVCPSLQKRVIRSSSRLCLSATRGERMSRAGQGCLVLLHWHGGACARRGDCC